MTQRELNPLLISLVNGEEYPHDAVDAILAGQGYDPAGAKSAVDQLGKWRQRADWSLLLQAYARCVRITRDQSQHYEVDSALFSDPAEIALHEAYMSLESKPDERGSIGDFLSKIEILSPAITKFFEDVLVMVDDANVRQNRLGLLQQISDLAVGIADLSLLEGF
jgi:glycyl-tRNA synthetase